MAKSSSLQTGATVACGPRSKSGDDVRCCSGIAAQLEPNIYKRPSGRLHFTSPARNKVGLNTFQEMSNEGHSAS